MSTNEENNKDDKKGNDKYLNLHIERLKEYNKQMKKYEETQQRAKETSGFSLMGFPSKPKFEDILPGGLFYQQND